MTNKGIATASARSLDVTDAHILGGGGDVHVTLLASDASDVLKGFVSVIWHGVTANLLICSLMLLIAARNQSYRMMLTGLVIANYLAFTGLFLFYGITRLGSVFLMVPWISFAIIVSVAAVGLWVDRKGTL